MKIGMIGPLWEDIPPKNYGGTEQIVYELVNGLVSRGNDVTLFSHGEAKTDAHLSSTYPHPLYKDSIPWTNISYPLIHISEALKRHTEFDVIHMHLNKESDYLALPLITAYGIQHKTLLTIHFVAPVLKGLNDRQKVLEHFSELQYISISDSQRKHLSKLQWKGTVYNGIDLASYAFSGTPQEYWLWLGKFNPDKGAHLAIKAAREANVKLILAGKIDLIDSVDKEYYEKEVKPLIDGKQITYVGSVGGKEKSDLYKNAIGFLNPIQWEEPFGLVMAESQAAGTPVISYRRGAAEEIIIDGETGFLVDSFAEMVSKIKDIQSISRKNCRKHIENNFTTEKMIDGYESHYASIIGL